ncbi:MAG TPA: TetR/AcrR family transcriptional regulator [Gemmatimonadaceae bacterium]|nr:TetR/AcrR family transcriptional regulator [Gemmatimonadaceae bacterium]
MSPRRSDARERILREAMRLFAEKGYERTSIADIQAAAGLTPGSGALYKHFPSKEAVLQAGMSRFMAEAARAREVLSELPPRTEEALERLAREAMTTIGGERDEHRIAWRELEQFPDLQTRVRDEVMQATYRAFAGWLAQRVAAGEMREHDTEAMAAVLVGSLAMFRVFEALWGVRTLPVSDDRFIQAWVELTSRGLKREEE